MSTPNENRLDPAKQVLRRSVPLHLRLMTLSSVLVLLTAICIGSVTYVTTRSEVGRLAIDGMRSQAQKATEKTYDMFNRASANVELLSAILQNDSSYGVFAGVPPTEEERSKRYQLFLDVLRSSSTNTELPSVANTNIMSVSFADRNGHWTTAYRDSGGAVGEYMLEYRWLDGGKPRLLRTAVDKANDWHPASSAGGLDAPADCRTLPWYTQAVSSGGVVWTPPHPIIGSGEPTTVMTVSVPLYSGFGEISGVLAISVNLRYIGRFVSNLHIGGTGKVYLLTDDLRVVAPLPSYTTRIDTSPDRRPDPRELLPEASKSTDEIIRVAAAKVKNASRSSLFGGTPFGIDVEGADYLGVAYAVDIGDKLSMTLVAVRSVADIQSPFRLVPYWIVGWSAAILMLTYMLAWFMALQVTRPVRALAADIDSVAKLQFDDQPSEPAVIAEIRAMALALGRLKTAMRSFTRYVPHDLVQSVLKTGKEVRLGGETAYITVLFADVVGFSTSAEQLAPDEVVRRLSVFLKEVDGVVRENAGLVVQNVGDCVMAIWDAPIRGCSEPEKHACAAVLDYISRASNPTSERPLEGRIGIHSGHAVVGNVGSDDVMSYTAIGDAVNVASRIEGLTRLYGAKNLISEATANAALDAFEMRRIDTVILKGRKGALEIYEILARKGELSQDRIDLRQRYESGLRLYQNNEFEAAAEEFDHALQIDPMDRPSQVLLDRCLRYESEPPATEWAGSFMVENK